MAPVSRSPSPRLWAPRRPLHASHAPRLMWRLLCLCSAFALSDAGRPTFLGPRSVLHDGLTEAQFVASWQKALEDLRTANPLLTGQLPCVTTAMGPTEVNNCTFRAYPPRRRTYVKSAWTFVPSLLDLALNPRVLAAVQEITGEPRPLLWGVNVLQRDPGDMHLWHLDVEMGECWDRSATVWVGLSGVDAGSSLYVINSTWTREQRFVVPAALVRRCTGSKRRAYCRFLHRRRDLGTHIPCKKLKAADVGVGCAQANEDLRGRQTHQLLDVLRSVDPAAAVVHLAQRDAEFVAFAGSALHMSVNTGARRRVAVQLQYTAPDCPIRVPSSYFWPRPRAFEEGRPHEVPPALDARRAPPGAPRPAAPRNYVVDPGAPAPTPEYSDIKYLLNRPAWAKEVVVVSTGRFQGQHAGHKMAGVLQLSKDIKRSQTCHLAGFDVTTSVHAEGVEPHGVHFHDRNVHEVCYQHTGTTFYRYQQLPTAQKRTSIWEGGAGTVTFLPGGEAHNFACSQTSCKITCLKMATRARVEASCRAALAAAEPPGGAVPGDDVSAGLLYNVGPGMFSELFPRRGKRYARLFRGTTRPSPASEGGPAAPPTRLHLHVDRYEANRTLAAHADYYDVFILVLQGSVAVSAHSKGRARVHTARERDLILKPGGVAMEIQSQSLGAVLLVFEISV